MSPTLAVRPMHPPAFETIPELSPVLEYTSCGATKSNNYSYLPPLSFETSSSSTLHPSSSPSHQQHLQKQPQVQVVEYTPLGRVIPQRPSTGPAPSSNFITATPATVARSQLPPLNTALPPPIAAYPMYPGLQTPPSSHSSKGSMSSMSSAASTASSASSYTSSTTTVVMDRKRGPETKPLNRPRKISTSHGRDGSSASTTSTRSGYEQQQQQTAVYSTTQQQQLYHQQQQYRAQYQSPTSGSPVARSRRRAPGPNELFGALPGEVLEVILECLKELHLDPKSNSCTTCWARDLCSLSLASRKWSKVARLSLYQDIQIVGADSLSHRKKFKITQGCRMTLLRRTLRANAGLAETVRSLKVPMAMGENCDTTPSKAAAGSSPKELYENRVAALIMACPNLEVLAGPMATYNHNQFNRITHALSTRTNLKTMDWRIEAVDANGSSLPTSSSTYDLGRPGSSSCGSSIMSSAFSGMLPGPLDAAQETNFLGFHRSWTSLTSVSIHCLPGASLAPDTLLQRTLTCLPSLKHLHLSRLPANAFSDATLLSLPPLQTLTLSHISGISSGGLSAFATRPNSRGLRGLHLRHTPLTSLPALARLLSHLRSLTAFSLVQDFSPLMPVEDDVFALWMMPYLASSSVTKLHWDIMARLPAGTVSDADDILARSIEAGGFPALRSLRAPSDPEGVFQALCRPLEVIARSSDRIWANGGRCGSSHGRGGSASSIRSVVKVGSLPKSATAASLPTGSSFAAPLPHGTDLRAARIAAQARLDDARPNFRFQVNVHSEEGQVVDAFGLGGFVGTVGSPIDYCLRPDAGSSDELGGLVDVPDIAAPGGEALQDGVSGCTGSWNWREGVVADKREKEKWWHTERGRWIRPRLD